MSIFMFSRHRRYAVRHEIKIRQPRGRALAGTMVEISSQSCRVSACRSARFEVDQPVTIEIAGIGDIEGHIRSASDTSFAMRFISPIRGADLQELVRTPAEEPAPILQLPADGV